MAYPMMRTFLLVSLVFGIACGDDDRPIPDGGVADGSVDAVADGEILDGEVDGEVDAADAGPEDAALDSQDTSVVFDGGPPCMDGVVSAGETDIDCGGEMCEARCVADQECVVGADCDSAVCIGNTCQPARCEDGLQNGAELGVDCGGGECSGCPLGTACTMPSDCDASGMCVEGFCQTAHCFDEMRNGGESDIDCGGADCGPCDAGQRCSLATDCDTGTCTGGFCLTETCLNGELDAGETHIDCGGGMCPGCVDGQTCEAGAECLSDRCDNMLCTSCMDTMMTGDETAVDCGGLSCAGCTIGQACILDTDCGSNSCEGSVCAAGARSCLEILLSNPAATSGVYEIQPTVDRPARRVYCDMTTDGGGWSLVAVTLDDRLKDQAGEYHAELASLSPTMGHVSIWDGMRGLDLTTMDIRFTCRKEADAATNDVDLSFYGNNWYNELTSSTDEDLVCFGDGSSNTHNITAAPERRNNLTSERLVAGDSWERGGTIQGENSCTDSGDFTVDFDDGGMDRDDSDTDWGNDDSSGRCVDTDSTGVWMIFVREALCSNGVLDAGEVAIDCGGRCGACPDGTMCGADVDCSSERCDTDMTCTSCRDGALNGDEIAVDCGGSCGGCPGGSACTAPADCASNMCTAMVCEVPASFYNETFESDDGGWVSGGTMSSWAWGMPTGTIISAAAEGANAWVTNLSGDYANSEDSHITSPVIDMSGSAADPVISFSLNYIAEGTFRNYDNLWLELSVADGPFTKVEAIPAAINWYNATTPDAWSDNSEGWIRASNVLTGAGGQSNVRLRFHFTSDGSSVREGFGIDDIEIGPAAPDLAVEVLPSATLCSSADVRVTNVGSATITLFELQTTIDGGAVSSEMIAGALAPGDTIIRSVAGNMISATAVSASDVDESNNTDSVVLNAAIAGAYRQTFESGAAGWQAVGTNSSWALGAPGDFAINTADSPENAWVTNLSANYNDNESSMLVSPCFDFSASASDPTFSVSQIFRIPSTGDHAFVEITVDGGTTWTKLGTFGTGTNWYNDLGGDWWDGSSSMSSGLWRRASHPMTGAAGQSGVRVRIVFESNASGTNEGIGIDDIAILVP